MSLAFVVGVGTGIAIMLVAILAGAILHSPRRDHAPRLTLPPASRRRIERARRANRADLRPAQRQQRLWVAGDFDREDTAV